MRDEAYSLVDGLVDGHPESDKRHDRWAADNKEVAARIIAYDVLARGIVTSMAEVVSEKELPTRDQVGAIVHALAVGGSGPFSSDDPEANRIVAPLRWSADWDCYEYGSRAFALSGIYGGLHHPFEMPDIGTGVWLFTRILQDQDDALPPLAFTTDDVRHNAHGSTMLRVAAYDGSEYGRMTVRLGRRGFSGHLAHARIGEMEARAGEMVKRRHERWEARRETDAKVAPVRKTVEKEIAQREHVTLLSVSFDPGLSHYADTFLVRLRGRDDSLDTAVLEVELSARKGATRVNVAPLRKLLKKLDAMEKRAEQGLMIDVVLARALDGMGTGFVEMLAQHVRAGRQPNHFNPAAYVSGRPGVATAFAVRDGCIVAKVHLGNGGFWNDGRITVQDTALPLTVMATVPGMRLGKVVDHALFDADLVVEKATMNAKGSLLVRVTPVRVPVDRWIAERRT